MDMENQGNNLLVFSDAGGRFRRKMLVIGASVDPEYPAERFDRVLEAEFVNGV